MWRELPQRCIQHPACLQVHTATVPAAPIVLLGSLHITYRDVSFWLCCHLCHFCTHSDNNLRSVELWDASSWPLWLWIVWPTVVVAGLELLAVLILQLAPFFRTIKSRGKPLEVLTHLDWAFILFNKLSTSVFTYHLLRYCAISGNVDWDMARLDWTLLPQTAALFVVYDLFYTLFHMALHQRGIYKHVHKVSCLRQCCGRAEGATAVVNIFHLLL